MEQYSSPNWSVMVKDFPYHLLITNNKYFDLNFVLKRCVLDNKIARKFVEIVNKGIKSKFPHKFLLTILSLSILMPSNE